MAFFVRLPPPPISVSSEAAKEHYLNIINGSGTLGQRELRRNGYAGYERPTAATCCALFELMAEGTFGRSERRAPNVDTAARFTFFDIGANGGHYTFLCKGLYRSMAHVVSFEPAPESYKWLKAINEANRLEVITENKAMSDEAGTATLYLSAKSDASNSLNPDFRAHAGVVEVECITLDDYCEHTRWTPDFIKLDTETHEAQVLRGGLRLLQDYHPFLIVECLNSGGVDYGAQIAEVLRQVGGYHFYWIGADGELKKRDNIVPDRRSNLRDWLVSPVVLPDRFQPTVARWSKRLAECTPQTHVIPPKDKRPAATA